MTHAEFVNSHDEEIVEWDCPSLLESSTLQEAEFQDSPAPEATQSDSCYPDVGAETNKTKG